LKHQLLIIATSNSYKKSKSATSQTFIYNTGKKHLQILQHPKISIKTSWATYCNMEKNIYKSCNIQKSPLKHHEIPIATWKKGHRSRSQDRPPPGKRRRHSRAPPGCDAP
jgi:hypothetical protein